MIAFLERLIERLELWKELLEIRRDSPDMCFVGWHNRFGVKGPTDTAVRVGTLGVRVRVTYRRCRVCNKSRAIEYEPLPFTKKHILDLE